MNSDLLDSLLSAWDRHHATVRGLLSAVPPHGFAARVLPDSPTVSAMFAHMHYERMCSLKENTPEYAGPIPAVQWDSALSVAELQARLEDSATRLRQGVRSRIEAGRPLDKDFEHPLHLLQFLVFHESYHHGQIKLALKAIGSPLEEEVIGPLTWDVWRARHGQIRDIEADRQ